MILKLCTVVYTTLSGWTTASTSLSSAVSSPPTGHVERVFPDERTFLLNVPEAYEHGVPHPLVLSFHGGESRGIT
jgi:poly(3-hydroxybutyrate) depolymerase